VPRPVMVEADGFDMDLLARRMAEVRTEPMRLIVLDSMVPGQRLSLTAPAKLVEMLRRETEAGGAIGMIGRQRLQLFSHGVVVEASIADEEMEDGSAEVVLTAGRLFELKELGDDEGSRWLGREAQVRFPSVDSQQPSNQILKRSEALSALVDEWLALVRDTGRERSDGQLDGVLADLGQMPDVALPEARALWVAGLINPLPALGVALVCSVRT
jgi:hypothetical protein